MDAHTAYFTIRGRLLDFLPRLAREAPVHYRFTGRPAVKDAAEAIGIPHPEIGRILMNGTDSHFYTSLANGDFVELEPEDSVPGNATAGTLHPPLPCPPRFLLDVHLGALARKLRLTGMDTAYHKESGDAGLVRQAILEDRILLTRDTGLLKHAAVRWGYWLRSDNPEVQWTEVNRRYGLWPFFQIFSRCLRCNGSIVPVPLQEVRDQLPERTRASFTEFFRCTGCGRVYWKGSHYERMCAALEQQRPPDR
ncbi:MAG TPA: Mut7-C RNAse domain-containing protein [Chitinophagaceae bacterium]|jgi:hypothetical protein|nr:Mut7-C RNAse domain-containing protein [Chitinophagaceae bacterium]